MLNKITIMGRLTKDVELRRTNNGSAVSSFTVAVDRDFAKDGVRETDFFECVAWGKTAEFIERNFSKGKMIVVAGRLQIRDWTDKNEVKRKTPEIIVENAYFGESRSVGERYEAAAQKPLQDFAVVDGDDGDLPF